MKVNKMKEKVSLVCSPEELMKITICLSESPNIKNRMVALEIKESMDELNKKESK